MAFSIKNLTDLISLAIKNNASDIHLRTDEPPSLRINGSLVGVQSKPISLSNIKEICEILLKDTQSSILDNINEVDGGFEIPDVCRLRYNIFRYQRDFGIIMRIIKSEIPSIESLKLPPVISKICQQKRGLILVTGPTGSGKTTTLTAMINHINSTKANHILTLEDPIEYLHKPIKSKVTQREIGTDTENYATGLRSALRQDPDVILIGEMRDNETISTALKAAETGHVVFSTLHTTNSINTIGRIVSMFPSEEQEEIKKRLSENLYAIIGQRLLTSVNKKQVAAQEIMVTNPGVRECILGEEPLSNITGIIERGAERGGNGSQSFNQHIGQLFKKGLITKEEASASVSSEADFLQSLIIEK